MAQATADEPTGLPVVESCSKQVQQQKDRDKSNAIAICVRSLKKAGRIRQREDGTWVQVNPNRNGQSGQQRQRQERPGILKQ